MKLSWRNTRSCNVRGGDQRTSRRGRVETEAGADVFNIGYRSKGNGVMKIQLASDLHLEFLEKRFRDAHIIEPASGADSTHLSPAPLRRALVAPLRQQVTGMSFRPHLSASM